MAEAEERRVLRVGYLASCDPFESWAFSGTHSSMSAAIRRAGAEVCHIGRSYLRQEGRLAGVVRRLKRRVGLPSAPGHLDVERWRKAVRSDLRETPCDVLLAPVASMEVAALQESPPFVYLSDTTARLFQETYADSFRGVPAAALKRMDDAEAVAIQRATRLVYPSSWAAASAVRDYGADPGRIVLAEFGANLENPPSAQEALPRGTEGECQLLLVGRDWTRKGGSIARAALVSLLEMGVRARLTVIGMPVPPAERHPALVEVGLLDKTVPAERARFERAYLEAHFFVMPSRAECFGIVFCEANAYGLPVFAARVGGIPDAVHDGENGHLLEPSAGGPEFARAIAHVWRTPGAYRSLAKGARAAFETRLNWDRWASRVLPVLAEAGLGTNPQVARPPAT